MTTPQEKLAESLEALKALQDRGIVAIRARELSRNHRQRLLKNGFIREVMKGWYIPAKPDERAGANALWQKKLVPVSRAIPVHPQRQSDHPQPAPGQDAQRRQQTDQPSLRHLDLRHAAEHAEGGGYS
jgi:hypothetical protein